MYKRGEENGSLAEFNSLSNFVFRRDKQNCQACFKTKRKLVLEDKFLTAHHIIARSDGGDNDMDNLITLCNACHNKIEELKLRSKEEIFGYFTEDKRHWYRKTSIGSTWQNWVYGGYQRPRQ